MSGFSVGNNEHLIRSNIWSTQIKQVLLDELFAMKYVDMITEFPDGNTINIPSIGQAEVVDFAEGQAVKYTALDTGNFTFSINKYKSAATFITNQMQQYSFYTSRLIASFVPGQHRALMKALEVDLLAAGPAAQTASQLNPINGGNHRFVAGGANNVISIQDFARALYALKVANVPQTDLIAIVDPSVEYTLNTLTNLVNVSNNPQWEGIITSGLSTGMKFLKNIYGFDVYTSMNLPSGISETINSRVVTNGVANQFFSAAQNVKPLVGLIRQAPKVDSEYNKDLQREEYVTTCRYGFGFFRPENFVVVLSDAVQALT